MRDTVDKAGSERLLSAKGISVNDTVVLYGGNNDWFAVHGLLDHFNIKNYDGSWTEYRSLCVPIEC